MRVSILASGSRGNATLFQTPTTSILVDAGTSLRALTPRAPRLDAIVITHAHQDHTGEYARLARRLKAQVYMTEATARAVQPGGKVTLFGTREPLVIRDLTVFPTPLPHDAAQVGLVVSDGLRRAALVTDLGEVPPGLVAHLRGCDLLMIESNHDIDMLVRGPYRDFLKRRILSSSGHLSNEQTHALLRAHYRDARSGAAPGAHTVVLMHLSETNNTPQLALDCAADALAGTGARLLAASQTEPLSLDVVRADAGQLALW